MDSQSNCWVNLRILSQPCECYFRGPRAHCAQSRASARGEIRGAPPPARHRRRATAGCASLCAHVSALRWPYTTPCHGASIILSTSARRGLAPLASEAARQPALARPPPHPSLHLPPLPHHIGAPQHGRGRACSVVRAAKTDQARHAPRALHAPTDRPRARSPVARGTTSSSSGNG
jgi:hypothetical protein